MKGNWCEHVTSCGADQLRVEPAEQADESSRGQRQTTPGLLGSHEFSQSSIYRYPRESANGENTAACMKYLQAPYPNKKLIMIWDGASYHENHEVQAYLSQTN